MGVTKQEGQKQYVVKRLVDIALALLLAIAAIFAIKTIKKDFSKIKQKPESGDAIVSSGDNENVPGEHSIYVSEAIGNEAVNQGSLIVVNGGAEYKWNEDGLKSIMEVKNNDGTDCYTVMDNDVRAREAAAVAMNDMIKAFSKETDHNDIRIDSAYRSVAEQESIYDNADDKSTASEPGFSDYHTGYSIDLNVVDDEGNSLDFDGEGDYEWFANNCHKYGFVLRFPEGKEDMTGQNYRPWHFRYVGCAHASYMKEKNFCLEEYTKALKLYPYDGNHLEVSDANGKKYEIYYFAADFSTALTSVAVPSEYKYEISGNNSDGFIITVDLSSSASSEPEKPASENENTKETSDSNENDNAEDGAEESSKTEE